jgi:hypothetical protein
MRQPRNISAYVTQGHSLVDTAGGGQVMWGLETVLAAEKCAEQKAKVATKCE